ncbi:phage minor capsid protein [Streptomyces sp. BPTC-684]|uniref:phage minor capsid protein n=1 Tax=Streptomyces sp. BPTC-684 TaxID=3043734 RepID=UPI0024B09464|nr:phage minor capsid protein [Streptomyces sp. BPTC-684]WHM36305.1 phage capsid protein [Streptomyces sp. BPTC-684]
MPINPGMVEPLAERSRDLYAAAEERLLAIIARQLADGLDAPGWAERKLAAVQQVRRASQGVVDELGKAVTLDVFEVIAEAYNTGHRAAVAELGALSDDARALVDDVTPNAQAVDRLAAETVDRVTSTHRSILRAVVDMFRAVVAEVTATPLLSTGTRRQATQDAMRRFADAGIRAFTDRAGRRWQLTSYAEMAVRTSVGRAATEAHMRALSDAGIELVVVSDAPRECPLCRPWEGKVLSIDGPGGERTVEVEHAIDDGRMIPVRVAGTLDEARLAGLQHPNCRHSVSAYTPGLPRAEQAVSDPAGYEAGQRQRAIERKIRQYKRREAAAVTPEAKRAARLKIRQWQGAMRTHLAAHPDLRRLRHREQPGASNLPEPRREATPEQVEAARLWSGDDATPREMGDDQLAAAVGSGLLDDQARARVEAEADRRDLDDLLARITPGGTVAEDLTQFGDSELARAYRHLDDADALRVMAEMDRRDRAAQLPGVRAELVGLSDHDLAARARNADEDTLALIATEAARRDLLARLFPGGQLRGDLSDLSDDELAWAMQYATDEELLKIAAELDRRDEPPPGTPAAPGSPPPIPPPAGTGDPVDDLLADRNTLAALLDPAPPPDGWGSLADDAVWAELVAGDESFKTPDGEEQHEQGPRLTRAQARALYDEYVYDQFLKAEADCNGYLLNKKATAQGVNPVELFRGPARIAYARASDELKEWWKGSGRLTQAEFIEAATGQRQRWSEGARKNESDHQNKR